MKPLTIVLALVPSLALAQAAPTKPAPAPTLSPAQTTEELAKLHAQVTALKAQVGAANDDVQSLQQQLDEAQQKSDAFQQQVSQLQDRGSTNEEQRVERIHTLDQVSGQSIDVDYLLTLGADDLDAYLANLQQSLEGVQQSAGATSGRLEYQQDTAAVQSIQAARQALADGDYWMARGYLVDALTYGQAAQSAAGANPMRAWTGR